MGSCGCCCGRGGDAWGPGEDKLLLYINSYELGAARIATPSCFNIQPASHATEHGALKLPHPLPHSSYCNTYISVTVCFSNFLFPLHACCAPTLCCTPSPAVFRVPLPHAPAQPPPPRHLPPLWCSLRPCARPAEPPAPPSVGWHAWHVARGAVSFAGHDRRPQHLGHLLPGHLLPATITMAGGATPTNPNCTAVSRPRSLPLRGADTHPPALPCATLRS